MPPASAWADVSISPAKVLPPSSSRLALTPSPSAYQFRSQFEGDEKHGKTFGVAREAYTKVYLKSASMFGKETPGPGAYNTVYVTGRNPSKYTMRLKTAPSCENYTAKIVPGPGQYVIPPAINTTGRFIYAKYRNCAATLFSPPSLKRFSELSMFSAPYRPIEQGYPGPANYNVPGAISSACFVSRFRSSVNVKFTHAHRGDIVPPTNISTFHRGIGSVSRPRIVQTALGIRPVRVALRSRAGLAANEGADGPREVADVQDPKRPHPPPRPAQDCRRIQCFLWEKSKHLICEIMLLPDSLICLE